MLPDAVELVKTIKKAAVDAMEAVKPVNICFGTVESTDPLLINVEQKMRLGKSQLVLCRNVTDYSISVSVNWKADAYSQPAGSGGSGQTKPGGNPEHTHEFETPGTKGTAHDHNISGKKEIVLHNALSVGDEVVLLRQQGGQKYVVMDRIGGKA